MPDQRGWSVTVLLENVAAEGSGLACEHGLSLWIETPEGAFLFDTGTTGAFALNAGQLGVDLSRAAAIVLSHGHYDHAGGLPRALEATSAPLYAGREATTPKHARSPDGVRSIGMDRDVVRRLGGRLRIIGGESVASAGATEILPGVEVLPAAPIRGAIPADNARLLRAAGNDYEPDPFEDEISVVLHTPSGTVLVTGCSHRGIGNIYEQAGRPPIVVGGFHLVHEDDQTIREIAAALAASGGTPGVEALWAGHCTGERAWAILAEMHPGRVHSIPAGTKIQL